MLKIDALAAITLGIAIAGLILGIINTWNQLDQRKIKLRVVPVLHQPVDFNMMKIGPPQLGVNIVNLSSFPVILADAGVTDSKSFHCSRRITLKMYMMPDGKPWPRKLGPRESLSLAFSPELGPSFELGSMRYAYAMTQCEHFACGSSPALRSYIDIINEFLHERGRT